MAINRGAKPGRTLRIPLLCDPTYQERRAAFHRPKKDDPDGDDHAGLVDAEERFAASLDPGCLPVSLDGVSHVVIRAISGTQFEAADSAVPAGLASTPSAMYFRRQVERVRRGLVWFDGDPIDAAPKPLYDVDVLAEQTGALWPELRNEIANRIEVFSTMGESVGSACVPSSAEPT
jgi:hypothetical protein